MTTKDQSKRQQRINRARELAVLAESQASVKAGRPSLYRPEFDETARKVCLLGATNAQLADFLGVGEAAINDWLVLHPGFARAVQSGRVEADAEIAASLYHRAKGYSHGEDDIRTVSVGGGVSEVVITPTVKHYPPDTQAASLWLRNRHPERWKDKVDVDANVRVDAVVELRAFLAGGSRLPIKNPD